MTTVTVDTDLRAVLAQADRLLARIHAGRGVSAREATAFRRRVAEVPRDTGVIPSWRFAELDTAVREIARAAAAPEPVFRAASSRLPASPGRRENPRLAALRARVERFEARKHVLSCDLVNLEAQLKVLRTARRVSAEDVRQIDPLVRRVQALAHRNGARRAVSGRRRSSEGHGFVAVAATGAVRLAAGEMAHGPRTSNKGRPARSAWSFGGGLPSLGKR